MHPQQLIAAYKRGENITALLKKNKTDANDEPIIETAYDLQAGTKIRKLANPEVFQFQESYGKAIARQIKLLTNAKSLLEAGVGEGTTLSFVLDDFNENCPLTHAIDISWSRLACCRDWLHKRGHRKVELSVASLFHLPFLPNSFDVVYTSHAIEPNGGHEIPILRELFRVASRYLVLLEPGYEMAGDEARKRMEVHGYCRGILQHCEDLGMEIVKHEPFHLTSNRLNPTTLTVIKKNTEASPATPSFACPKFGGQLVDYGDSLFSPEGLRAYPKIDGIPCLRFNDGVIASRFEQYRKKQGSV